MVCRSTSTHRSPSTATHRPASRGDTEGRDRHSSRLAILLHAGVDPDTAVELHQTFKWDTVAHWHDGSHAYKPLDLEVDVAGWLDLNAYGTGGRSR